MSDLDKAKKPNSVSPLPDKSSNNVESGGPEVEERGEWGSSAEFVLSCLGYAVGLGNVWRFPYLVYSNGGGAFLIPYAIMVVFVGLPIFFMEMIVGQYSACGPMDVWSISPIFQGVGAGMVVITAMTSINYNMVMGWAFYYLFASWQKKLPWYDCKSSFNTAYCYTKREAQPCEDDNGTWFNQTCFNQSYISSFEYVVSNCSDLSSTTTTSMATCANETFNDFKKNITQERISASQEYFDWRVLDRSSSIDETGEMKYEMVLILFFAWIVCYLCVVKGIKSAGKVVYFTATFPYLMLIILLIRGAMLPGARAGVDFYIKPKWDTLKSAKVWVDAAGQVFFSLSVGMGGLMTFASYNKFNNNIYRDTLIVVIMDGLTSFFAGFVIFSIMGHLAETLDKAVPDVVQAGSGLAFIAYPEVVTYMPPPQLWSSLFFLMLITLGIDTQMASIETIMTPIVDAYPHLRRWKPLVAFLVCAVLFLLGLTLCTQAGAYWMDLLNYYSSGWSLVLIALCEAVVFPWFYGARRLMADVETMTGIRLWHHWWFCFKFLSPIILVFILVFNIIDFTPLTYGDKEYPYWSQVLGWLMAIVSIATIPVWAVWAVWKSYSQPEYDGLNFGKRLWKLTQPSSKWGPSIEKGNLRPPTDDFVKEKLPEESTELSISHGENNNGYANTGKKSNDKIADDSTEPPRRNGAMNNGFANTEKELKDGMQDQQTEN